jgi:hypothetical protein
MMPTLYFILFTVLGGVIALFVTAGVASYQYNKLPDMDTMFRWFMAGTVTSGLGSYAYLFGANGDPSALLQNLGDAMEVNKVVETITSATDSVTIPTIGGSMSDKDKESSEITVGMPGF